MVVKGIYYVMGNKNEMYHFNLRYKMSNGKWQNEVAREIILTFKNVSHNLVQIHFCLIFCYVFHLNYLIMTKKEHRNLNKFLLDSSIFLVGV